MLSFEELPVEAIDQCFVLCYCCHFLIFYRNKSSGDIGEHRVTIVTIGGKVESRKTGGKRMHFFGTG